MADMPSLTHCVRVTRFIINSRSHALVIKYHACDMRERCGQWCELARARTVMSKAPEDSPEDTPLVLKRPRSLSGAAKYDSKFNPDWQLDCPFASLTTFYCSVCMKDVSCCHQEVADLKRHEKSASCIVHSLHLLLC